ncbi:MAG: SapC family protein [Henriciella sp.]
MSQHVAVNPLDHKSVRILEQRSEEMGDGSMICVSFPEEFRRLQAHYPILFQRSSERDEFTCVVLMGFENGENLFLKDDRWDAAYIPLAMDVQPFLIGMPEKDGEDRKVVLDLEHPRVSEGEGQRIFDDAGEATTYLENISTKLDYLDKAYRNAADYLAALQKYELLESLAIDVTMSDGEQNRLAGFHTIHEEKLAALDERALKDLHQQGYLLPTYMAVASLSNLTALIERKDVVSGHDS